ncbi:MAG TPA: retroviral-like aspartic protease family protein [Chloroflexota bacterium]|nr:retroviral-like aspartic protease family protein [Chloroflexota bacterium]HUM70206.1 retroviral-like aspartic protease family protein [Chloroflexota bacterium]
MIPYSTEFDPPAAVIQIQVAGVVHSRPRVTISAILDTGADLTAVPETLVDRLNLFPTGRMVVEDVNGQTTVAETYMIKLKIADKTISEHKVLLTGLDFGIIGRDLLNTFYLLLNGPEGTFELAETSPIH